MTTIGWVQILIYCAIIVAITPVLGAYMTRVFNGERTALTPVLRPIEAALYPGQEPEASATRAAASRGRSTPASMARLAADSNAVTNASLSP